MYTKAVKIAKNIELKKDRDIFKRMDFRRLSYLNTLQQLKIVFENVG